MMRKGLIVLLIAALSLSMLVFLAGCGTNKNKEDAKKYMTSGDDYMDAVELEMASLDELQTSVITKAIAGDYSELFGAAGEATKQKMTDTFTGIAKNLSAANGEYKSIIALDDVQDYKDYANKMMEAIAIYENQIQAMEKLVADFETAIVAISQGQKIDIVSMFMGNEAVQAVTDLGEQADMLVKEAQQIKKDKKLDS